MDVKTNQTAKDAKRTINILFSRKIWSPHPLNPTPIEACLVKRPSSLVSQQVGIPLTPAVGVHAPTMATIPEGVRIDVSSTTLSTRSVMSLIESNKV